ncbi:MAG TPA: porphobilinogen synthase [Candidatus Krumholzibacteria bacterium]|nr:porphobilinogen synthase [Candidatus Krumholzibacteria bacterium]HPD72018.1 porphobilinogen synthase [Candidatus Krumholzibacteria bacterium]HRY41049.1 porphobilinogen synthase [Candidatus Krumholzibacteria bacterium]
MTHHEGPDHDHDLDDDLEIPAPGLHRPRRLRRSGVLRDLVAETRLHPDMFCQPHFVLPGEHRREDIGSMPGIVRETADMLVKTVEADLKLGLRHVLLFGLPAEKSPTAESALDLDGPVPVAIRTLKDAFGQDLLVSADICLCAYTDHGHCGVIEGETVDNDKTLPILAGMASACALSGVDIVAPSDMMDGRVGAIRVALDLQGLEHVAIMSYAAKYASAYYGPFREAADSAPAFGDRRSYQMDPRNAREALREVQLDLDEGADIVMVKPALAYLDVIRRVREAVHVPVACYNVSGEYSMVKAAAAAGLVDLPRIVMENLHAMARAGADVLISYHGREVLAEGWL